MENTQKNKIKYISGLFLFLFVSLLIASWYVAEKQSDYVSLIKVQIAEQETRLAALSELADRDGVDAVVNEIVRDCDAEDRQQFDQLLGRLSQLGYAELREIDNLFNSCGSYFAERKAVVVSRLQREYEIYADYIKLLTLVDDRIETLSPKQEMWSELVKNEKERSELSRELVIIQGDIIAALLEGVLIQSKEMQEMLKEAQNAKDSLTYLNSTIDILRKEVIDV